jgi:polysaccharide biosynthesis/export protein
MNSSFTNGIRKAVMKNRSIPVITVCLLACSVLSVYSRAQAVTAQASNSTAPGAGPASPAASDPAANGRIDPTYIIGANDVLSVNVWNEPNLTRLVTVRSDGKISLPLVGELQAAGRTPAQLDDDIAVILKNYIKDPQVAVIVQEIKSQNFNVLGEVTRPGTYPLIAGTTIVDAIAMAGGFKDFAKKKGVYILRQNPSGEDARIAFNYSDYIKGKNTSQNIKLQPHDTVIVP